ncbi:DUF3888 domain-containing protein [Bacillaceae bacterium W0354]
MELNRKIPFILILLISVALPLTTIAEEHDISGQERELLLALLEPHITEAVESYYGRPKQYDLFDAKFLEVEKTNCQFCFNIKVQVTTFQGAHNPPYGVEIMTLSVSNGRVVVTDYQHEEKK